MAFSILTAYHMDQQRVRPRVDMVAPTIHAPRSILGTAYAHAHTVPLGLHPVMKLKPQKLILTATFDFSR